MTARPIGFAASLLCLLSLAFLNAQAAPSQTPDPLDAWLIESRLPDTVVRALHTRRSVDAQAGQWLVDEGANVYVLVEQRIEPESHPQIRQARRNLAELRARHGLLLYAAGELYEQQGFRNREAIAKALSMLDDSTDGRLLPGLQSRSTVFDDRVTALVWTRQEAIRTYRRQPPPLERFLPAYCEALYPTARALLQDKQHRQALELYREMHARQCRGPVAYFLDAADCFIAIDQPADARRMASYVVDTALDTLSAQDAERAGDLLFQAGDQSGADRAYQRALDHLSQ